MGDGPLIIFAGRLVEEKGLGDLLLALRSIIKRFKDARLLVVGDGQDKDRFQRLTEELKLGEHVYYTGWIEQNGIRSR